MSLKIESAEAFEAMCTFADAEGLRPQLDGVLKYLDEYAEHGDRGRTRCRLFSDWAPHSMAVDMELRGDDGTYRRWFNGLLHYHSPSREWSVHT